MSGYNIDFSSKVKNLFAKDIEEKLSFAEKVVSAVKSKVEDHNSKNPNNKIKLSQAKEAYRRGANDAVRLSQPIGIWSMARLNLFLRLAKGASVPYSYQKLDRDILNTGGFYIDDGVREDISFSYEQVAESKFDLESFNIDSINDNQDFSFLDFEEYFEANFPKELKEEKDPPPKLITKSEEDPDEAEEEEKKKKEEEDKKIPKIEDLDKKY
jgi:hypothetical protein